MNKQVEEKFQFQTALAEGGVTIILKLKTPLQHSSLNPMLIK
jgi:hypothetical protein